jgi:hypothetical protein
LVVDVRRCPRHEVSLQRVYCALTGAQTSYDTAFVTACQKLERHVVHVEVPTADHIRQIRFLDCKAQPDCPIGWRSIRG